MKKSKLAVFIMVLALALCVGLTACGGSKDEGGSGSVKGYQGDLEDGWSFVYIQLQDGTVTVSLTDDEHTEDDALTYAGKPVTDDAGKTTVTDDESGESVSFTLTDNGDGTASVDVDGYGKGELKVYEGGLISVIKDMALDDADDDSE